MKKILIDLDVLTLALWKGDKKEIAVNFLNRVKNEEFILITPYFILENLLNKWTYVDLRDKIWEFYSSFSKIMLTDKEIDLKIDLLKIDDIKIIKELINNVGVKDEDAFLALIVSIFNIDYLVTFNRKHLRNNKEKINEVLNKNGLKAIKIVEPSEI